MVKFFFTAALLSFCMCFVVEGIAKADQSSLDTAEKQFQAGEWDKAGQTLKAVLAQEGADSQPPAFFFNYGTALARSGAVGQGYIALMRAAFSAPFDGDIRQHLQKVEPAVPATARAVRPALWFSFWPSTLRFMSPWLWLVFSLTASAVAFWLLGSADKALPAAAGLLASVLLIISSLAFLQNRLPVSGVVSTIKVKSGPGNTFTDITTIEPGSLVNEDGERDGWRKIRFQKGDSEETVGWVEPSGLLGVR